MESVEKVDKMNKYEILHLDGNGETFIVEAESSGKAKRKNFLNWQEVFNGTFKEYLERLSYCRIIK